VQDLYLALPGVIEKQAWGEAAWRVSGTYRLLAHPTAFQHPHPSLSAPLLETGFFTLFMEYIATYWFAVDRPVDHHELDMASVNRIGRP
jgi:hypothetical protein